MAQVRYIVEDVDASVEFYVGLLDFNLKQQYGKAMAIVTRGDLQLWLAGPQASASQKMPDGSQPAPGGWNRIVLEVDDINAMVDLMREAGVRFRNEIVQGPGGQQILCLDPCGNVVELCQPA